MEFKGEVHILKIQTKIKKIEFCIFSLCILLSGLIFSSCSNIGFYHILFGEDDVDERFSGFNKLTDNNIPQIPETTDTTTAKYSFLVVSDLHFGASDVKQTKIESFLEVLTDLFADTEETKRPRFIINLGDTADGGHADEYKEFNSFCKKAGTLAQQSGIVTDADDFKVYTILGNHDLYNNGWKNYKKYIFPYSACYYFSFNFNQEQKPFTFIFLDTGNGAFGTKQLDALESLVKKDENNKIILSHYPFWGTLSPSMTMEDTADRNYLLYLFGKNNVKAIFGGHVHKNFTHDLGNFEQINTAPLFKDGYFRLVTIDESTAEISTELKSY